MYTIEDDNLIEDICVNRNYLKICDRDYVQACILTHIEYTAGHAEVKVRATIPSISKEIEGMASDPTIKKSLASLEKKGFISIEKLVRNKGMNIRLNRDSVNQAIEKLQ